MTVAQQKGFPVLNGGFTCLHKYTNEWKYVILQPQLLHQKRASHIGIHAHQLICVFQQTELSNHMAAEQLTTGPCLKFSVKQNETYNLLEEGTNNSKQFNSLWLPDLPLIVVRLLGKTKAQLALISTCTISQRDFSSLSICAWISHNICVVPFGEINTNAQIQRLFHIL